MKRTVLILAFLLVSPAVFPCLIFVFTSGNHIIVGNHEDWTARDARIRFIPAEKSKLGVVVFDFESEGLIQGGMNSAGLFFDGTATPYVPLDFTGKEVFKEKDFWLTLLQTCHSIQEAVVFINKYQLPELESVHLLFADRSGQSLIVGAYDGKLTYTWKNKPFQVLTNFNIVDPEYGGEQPCPRFAKANSILTSATGNPMETAAAVLKQTTQGELTVYSTLFDITTGSVRVYYLADFSRSLTFNLADELAKGGHDILMSKQFR